MCQTFNCLHYSCLGCFSPRTLCIIFHVWVWNSIWMFLCVGACVHMCVNICMSMWVTHHYPVPMGSEFWCPSFSSSTANWTQWTFCCLHSPAPPILSVSSYLSHTLSCSSILPPSPSHFLSPPPAPRSTSPFLTHSTLSCVLSLFSLTNLPPSLFRTAPLCIYLCRLSLIQTQTLS